MSAALHQKWDALQDELRGLKRVLVAFSGGCDSHFLLAAAVQTLGSLNVLAVTAVSSSLALRERGVVPSLAEEAGARLELMHTQEMNNPLYVSNPRNRCFFCKDELFQTLSPIAEENGMSLVDGFNASDRADFRPGFEASQKWHVCHPLDQAALFKPEIRTLSRWLKLSTWNKPASPCLSSRIPYGSPVTEKALRQIENAENVVRAEGFPVVRVRHHGDMARIEVPREQIARLQEPERWNRIENQVKLFGYLRVLIEPDGFQSGRLNSL